MKNYILAGFFLALGLFFGNRAVADNAARLLQSLAPQYVGKLELELVESPEEYFEISGRRISGSTPVALAAGLNHYFKYACQAHLSWCGDQWALPPEPPAMADYKQVFPLPLRPYLNFCTFGYSMPWWDWPRWKREVDFMALNGINMPLAVTGIEKVWFNTFVRLGVPEEEMLKFLSGPAFLPWQWMINLDSHAGPMPRHWLETHAELGKQIVEYQLSWGMQPILPAFNGQVPAYWARQHPEAAVRSSMTWCNFPALQLLDPTDPQFAEITAVFLEELHKLYGDSIHHYALDLFHEQAAPDESPEYLANCGRLTFESLRRADPEAVWVMQAWTERRPIIEAIPKEGLLLLDIGKERLKTTGGLYGYPTVWGTINSFGGHTFVGGDLGAIVAGINEQRRTFPNLVGAGAFPESIFNNPVLFELVFETALRSEPFEVADWVADYQARRYGRDTPEGRAAWQLLLRDVYSSWRGDTIFGARPWTHIDRANAWSELAPGDTPERFFPAWGQLLAAGDRLADRDGYQFDVVDLGQQALAALAVPVYRAAMEAFRRGDAVQFRLHRDRFLQLLKDTDQLTGTRPEFRLDCWVGDARRWGIDEKERDFYEYNAKLQLTHWGPIPGPQPLFDYCARNWNGLLREYYLPRWEMFFQLLDDKLAAGESYDDSRLPLSGNRPALEADDFYRRMYRMECDWLRQKTAPTPEVLEPGVPLAARLYEHYDRLRREYRSESASPTPSQRGLLGGGATEDIGDFFHE